MKKERVYAYFDGSNFYHLSKLNFGITKIDFEKIANQMVNSSGEELVKIRYFNSPVNQQESKTLYKKQIKFLNKLAANPLISLHLGRLVRRPLNKINLECSCGRQIVDTIHCPMCKNRINVKNIFKSTEKGTDVSLGIHLLLDALNDKYDTAFLFSHDADFAPAVDYIIKNLKKKIVFCSFPDPKTDSLIQACSKTRRITKRNIRNSSV